MFSVLFDGQKGMQWEKLTVHLCWISAVSENGEYLINCGMMRCSQHVQVLKPLYHIISHVLFPLLWLILYTSFPYCGWLYQLYHHHFTSLSSLSPVISVIIYIYTHIINYTYHNSFPSLASSLSLHPETSNPFKSSSSG